jgi:hypothetical protein
MKSAGIKSNNFVLYSDCSLCFEMCHVLHLHISLTTFNLIGTSTFQGQAEKKLYTIYHYLKIISTWYSSNVSDLHSYHSLGTGFAMNIYHVLSL